MRTQDMVLVQGMHDTRVTWARWAARPGPVVGRWILLSLVIALALLGATWLVAVLTPPDPTVFNVVGFDMRAGPETVLRILAQNSLVLALHAFACVAGFIAGSSLPAEAERYSGRWRWVHDRAGPAAITFVGTATLFSLVTQAYILGDIASSLAHAVDLSPGGLLLVYSVHALPELIAVFLPLAAWLLAARAGRWHELLAATFVTVALAVPVLVGSAIVEVYVTPELLRGARYIF